MIGRLCLAISFWGPNRKRRNASRAYLQAQVEFQNEAPMIVGAEIIRRYKPR